MTMSHAHPSSFLCPRCQTQLQIDVWVIVDVEERPDLLARVLDGTLHLVDCTNCHGRSRLEAPLLVYRRAIEPHLLFSPAPAEPNRTSEDQTAAEVQWLVDVFRRIAGEQWRDAFVASGLPLVPRNALPGVLRQVPATESAGASPRGATVVALPQAAEEDVFALLNPLDESDPESVAHAAAAWGRISGVDLEAMPGELSIGIYLHGARAAWLRYRATRDPRELDRALSGWEQLVARTPGPASVRAERLNNLTVGLTARYDDTGDPAAARRAAAAAREAAALVAGDPGNEARYGRNRAAAVGNLGRALLKQYRTTGQAGDLDEAITCLVETLEVIPITDLAIDLAGALGQRFEAKGDLADLDEAIRRVRDATQHADAEADKGRALLTLGNLLCATYEHRRRPTDLDEAIRVYREAQSHFRETDADWLLCRNNYSTALRDKYLQNGAPAALDEAILVAEDVVRHAEDSPRKPLYLLDLAAQLLTRDEVSASDADLARSIQSLEEATQLAGPATREAAASAQNLARAYERTYERHRTVPDLERAIECYRTACQVAAAHQLGLMPDAVRSWASFALRRRSWREAIEATAAGLEAFERLYRTNVLRRDREAWQRAVRGIVLMHAYALARDGQLESAVTSLERGWGRQLTESLGPGRADLRNMERTDPALLETYRAVVARLRPLELEDRHPGSKWNESEDSSGAREGRALLRNARAELADVIARFHAHGAGLSAPSSEIDAIAGSLAEGQGIVYLFATPFGSLALIVSRRRAEAAPEPAPSVDAVWADTFSLEDLDRILVRRENGAVAGGYLPGRSANLQWLESSLREALPQLGARLIEPLAARLRSLAVSDVALVAGGMLSALPLAAATYAVNGRQSCLLDEFTLSIVPCATLLAHARQSLNVDPGEGPSLLAVGNPLPLPDGFEALAGAEAEVKEITDRFEGRVVSLYGPEATYAKVTGNLPGTTHLHLACHGLFASANPLFSSLVLAGGEALTLGSVLFEVDVRTVRLVVLSACETAVVDLENLPEEAVGFPAGFLQAGVAGVLATLWPVDDAATRRLMTRFYEFLFQKDASGGAGSIRPAMALRQAQRSLRSRDPIDWAGFVFYGAS